MLQTDLYNKINKWVDIHLECGIDLKNLNKYFSSKKNKEKFLKGLNVSDEHGIILEDILRDRIALSKDKKLESITESLVSKEEKFLCDYLHTSLGHIQIIDEKENWIVYAIEDVNHSYKVLLVSKEQLVNLKEQYLKEILEDLIRQLNSKIDIDINVDFVNVINEVSIETIKNAIDETNLVRFIENKLTHIDEYESYFFYKETEEDFLIFTTKP